MATRTEKEKCPACTDGGNWHGTTWMLCEKCNGRGWFPVWVPQEATSRQAALRTPCPTCRALPGNPCIGKQKQAQMWCHAKRHELAIRRGAPAVAA